MAGIAAGGFVQKVFETVNPGVVFSRNWSTEAATHALQKVVSYDRRFSNLEERFLQRFKEIESETARNLGAFETNAKKQVD